MKKRKNLLVFLLGIITATAYAQPVSHDPSNIVKEGDRYWAFHTGLGVYATSASDPLFKNWRNEGAVFSTSPAWIKTYAPGFDGHCWAPDIVYMNGKWHLYYSCSSWASNESAIGLATTTSLASKTWKDEGVVTYTTKSSNINAIDPDVFRDKDGNYWMTYGSYWAGIVVTPLDSLTGKPKNPSNITYIANKDPEAPAIIYKDNYYYLFFNRGACCNGIKSTYQMFVGRATKPNGPYYDKNGVNCNAGGGTSFLHTDGRFIGPGHFGLYGEDVLSYHYYDGHDNGLQKMKVATLTWKNGWPVAEYEREGSIPDGTYRLKNRNSGNYMVTKNESSADGAQVVLGSEKTNGTDQWIVKTDTDLSYKLYLQAAPAQTLEIPYCTSTQGDPVGIWTELTTSPCQNWYIAQVKQSANSYYILFNRNSNLVVEVENAYTAEGSKIQQWSGNENPCQQWAFDPVAETGINPTTANNDRVRISANADKEIVVEMQDERLTEGDITVYSLMGNTLYEGKIKSERTVISARSFVAGQMYIVSVTDSNGNIITKKIVM